MAESSNAPLTDEEVRERVYKAISNELRELTDGKPITRMSKELGRDVIERITEIIFTATMDHSYFRFPNGYGSLKVVRLKRNARPKRLPTGDMIEMNPNRVKLRYEEGAAVREVLGMPPKTNYQRRYRRRSILSKKTREVLAGTV